MSSTLFARGINTQTGVRQRAENMTKSMTDIKHEMDTLKDVPAEVRSMKAQIITLERRIEGLQALVEKLGAAKS